MVFGEIFKINIFRFFVLKIRQFEHLRVLQKKIIFDFAEATKSQIVEKRDKKKSTPIFIFLYLVVFTGQKPPYFDFLAPDFLCCQLYCSCTKSVLKSSNIVNTKSPLFLQIKKLGLLLVITLPLFITIISY